VRDPDLSYRRGAKDPIPAHAQTDAPGRETEDFLPRCLDLISADDVIRRIGLYFAGGAVAELTAQQRRICQAALAAPVPR
jgi:hypothetical protein